MTPIKEQEIKEEVRRRLKDKLTKELLRKVEGWHRE